MRGGGQRIADQKHGLCPLGGVSHGAASGRMAKQHIPALLVRRASGKPTTDPLTLPNPSTQADAPDLRSYGIMDTRTEEIGKMNRWGFVFHTCWECLRCTITSGPETRAALWFCGTESGFREKQTFNKIRNDFRTQTFWTIFDKNNEYTMGIKSTFFES